MVSPNLKAALIKGTLNEGRLNYPLVFSKIREMLDDAQQAEGVKKFMPPVNLFLLVGCIPTRLRSYRSSC